MKIMNENCNAGVFKMLYGLKIIERFATIGFNSGKDLNFIAQVTCYSSDITFGQNVIDDKMRTILRMIK